MRVRPVLPTRDDSEACVECRGLPSDGRFRSWNLKGKGAALAPFARYLDCAAELLDEFAADRKPEASPFMPTSNSGIELREWPKKVTQILLSDPHTRV